MIHYLLSLLLLFFQADMKDRLAEQIEVMRVANLSEEFLKNADNFRTISFCRGTFKLTG